MIKIKKTFIICAVFAATLSLHACTVVKVVDVAASTTIGVAKGTAKATGKVVGAAIPDGDDDDKKEESKD